MLSRGANEYHDPITKDAGDVNNYFISKAHEVLPTVVQLVHGTRDETPVYDVGSINVYKVSGYVCFVPSTVSTNIFFRRMFVTHSIPFH